MDWAAVATIISSLLGSGGVVMFFLDRRQKREEKAEAARLKTEIEDEYGPGVVNSSTAQ